MLIPSTWRCLHLFKTFLLSLKLQILIARKAKIVSEALLCKNCVLQKAGPTALNVLSAGEHANLELLAQQLLAKM